MSDKKNKTAGGSPAAGHFFLRRQEKSNQKEGDPGLPPLRGSLDQPQASGAAQLALAGRTNPAPLRSSNSARLDLRLLATDRGGAQGMKSENLKLKNRVGNKLPTILRLIGNTIRFRYFSVVYKVQLVTESQTILAGSENDHELLLDTHFHVNKIHI